MAEDLESARISGNFDELIVIAPPHFHGLLNSHFNGHVSTLISLNIKKDYTKANEKQLLGYLDEHL